MECYSAKEEMSWGVPGSPVVRSPPSNTGHGLGTQEVGTVSHMPRGNQGHTLLSYDWRVYVLRQKTEMSYHLQRHGGHKSTLLRKSI